MAKRPPLQREYPPIKRVSRTIPWGYKVDPSDPDMLLPVLPMLHLLEAAERAFRARTSTHAEIAAWLTAKTGVPITRCGLKKRLLSGNKKLAARAS
jgi:hypothetical protein